MSISRRALGVFSDQARQGRGMDAEPPIRYRNVPTINLADRRPEKTSSAQ
jgi:hypothetical protein